MKQLKKYYPIILAFISFLFSVTLWFSGYKDEGLFVGIWVPSILALSVAIRQRRNDYYRSLAARDAMRRKKFKNAK